MRKSGIVEKYVQLAQDMYEGSETVPQFWCGTVSREVCSRNYRKFQA